MPDTSVKWLDMQCKLTLVKRVEIEKKTVTFNLPRNTISFIQLFRERLSEKGQKRTRHDEKVF